MSKDEAFLSLLFTGDVFLGHQSPEIGQDLKSLTASADMLIVNLEAPLTAAGTPLEGKSLHLRSDPTLVETLQRLNVQVVSLANNHICDWGSEGLVDTLTVLGNSGIRHVGAGLNDEAVRSPLIIRKKATHIGFLAFSEPAIQTVVASTDHYGCRPLEAGIMRAAVEETRKTVQILVVLVHWGYTNYHYPLPESIELGRSLIDAGADLVVGHHPHVIQGHERYRHGAILYSLGNFIFSEYHSRGHPVRLSGENYLGLIGQADFVDGRLDRLVFHHSRYDPRQGKIDLVQPHERGRRERFLAKLSRPLSGKNYESFFKRYIMHRLVGRFVRWLDPRMWKQFNKGYWGAVKVAIRKLFARSGRD